MSNLTKEERLAQGRELAEKLATVFGWTIGGYNYLGESLRFHNGAKYTYGDYIHFSIDWYAAVAIAEWLKLQSKI